MITAVSPGASIAAGSFCADAGADSANSDRCCDDKAWNLERMEFLPCFKCQNDIGMRIGLVPRNVCTSRRVVDSVRGTILNRTV